LLEVDQRWLHEREWYCRGTFLPRDEDEERAEAAEMLGYLLGYAWTSGANVLASLGDPQADHYLIFFSFPSPAMKFRFLRMCQANEITRWEHEQWAIAKADARDLIAARPLADVLPKDVLNHVLLMATPMLAEDFFGPPEDTKIN